jgi:hypothetical protein
MVWRHIYRGRLRWAIPSLLIEETPEQVGLFRASRRARQRREAGGVVSWYR